MKYWTLLYCLDTQNWRKSMQTVNFITKIDSLINLNFGASLNANPKCVCVFVCLCGGWLCRITLRTYSVLLCYSLHSWAHKVLTCLDSQASAAACLNSWTVSPHALCVWVLICKANCSIVWIISRCVGLYEFISPVHAVFMSHNPALLYKALNLIVLINKPCYCLAWIYNPRHCSFPNSFIAVCIVGAGNPYAAVLSELSGECRNLFFVKVYKQLFCLVWRVKLRFVCAVMLSMSPSCTRTLAVPLIVTYPWKCSGVYVRSSWRL